MFENRPMQNLYFNVFAGNDLKNKWDFDYWGLGNREALDFIQKSSGKDKVTINAISFTPLEESVKLLNPNQRESFIFVNDVSKADYVVNNYRMVNKAYEVSLKEFAIYKEFRSGGETYLTIYKKKYP